FHAQHQAGAHDLAVDDDGAGAAVTRSTAFLAARQSKHVAQRVQHGLLRLAQVLDRLSVDRGCYVMLAHQCVFPVALPMARSTPMAAPRRASTPATLVRYSIVPRLSLIGLHAARAAASSFFNVSASSVWPTKASAASLTSSTVGATAPRETRA